MIPKIIHFCWYGGKKSTLAKKCIRSWKKYCKDYEIKEWNEDNFNIEEVPLYVKEAYEQKKWAFVSDYIRLQVIYNYGGIYLDTDVELLKPLDFLLEYPSFWGFQYDKKVATGLGFGAEKGSQIVKQLMSDYENISFFKKDGKLNTMPCPDRNAHVFLEYGLSADGTRQVLQDGSIVFEPEIFCPINYKAVEYNVTKNTVSIHWFDASWVRKKKLHVILTQRILGWKAYYYLKAKNYSRSHKK